MKIGCDIVENKRLINKDQEFINYVLTEKEQLLYKQYGNTFLFGRFAAKEAIMKSLPNTKDLKYTDIEILKGPNGEPITNIDNISVSISHEKKYTIAYAIYEGE